MKRKVWMITLYILAGFFLYQKRSALTNVAVVLIYTTAFCLLLAPACTRMERWGVRKAHAAAYAVIGVFLLAILLFSAFIPYMAVNSAQLFRRISPMAIEVVQKMTTWSENLTGTEVLFSESGGMIGMSFGSAAAKLIRAGMAAATQIGRITFSLVLTYYALCDRKKIACYLLLIVPLNWRKATLAMLRASRNAMMSYFSGIIKTSIFVAITTGIGLIMLGVQDAILLAMLMGILEILPYVGPLLASIPILLSAMMHGRETVLFAFVLIIFVQQIEGNFITPYFTASSTSVHPLTAVFSVFVGGSLFGIWGILFAIPTVVFAQSVIGSIRQVQDAIRLSHSECGQKFYSYDD